MTVTSINIQTRDGRVIGLVDNLTYSADRDLVHGSGDYFVRGSWRYTGSFTMGMPLDGDWLTKREASELFELVEPVDITIHADDVKCTLARCELMKDGRNVSYRDLVGLVGGFTFWASAMYFGQKTQYKLSSLSNEHEVIKKNLALHPDEIVCAQPLTKPSTDIFKIQYAVKPIEQDLLKEEEDPHKGMIYNPYSDKWSFL